jgi:tetratricopeptide (TPR) repeat protein
VRNGLALCLTALLLSLRVVAQDVVDPTQPAEPPNLAPHLLRALEAPYLTEEEGKDLRVFHGVWREGDLDTPERRAHAALMRGAYDDEALLSDDAPAEDRAEALIRLGRFDEAHESLADIVTPRAIRLQAEALEAAGRYDEALQAIEPLLAGLGQVRTGSAEALLEGVRGLMIRTKVAGEEIGGGNDFKAMMALLGRARDDLDRTYWPVRLVEAQLLRDKDNRPDAVEAALETLTLNPKAAEAWRLLGRLSVEGFDFARAEHVANRLDLLAPGPTMDSGSLLGDLLRVRMRLQQRDADDAERIIEQVLERAPAMPEALALQAAVAAATFDFERAEELVHAADARAPDSSATLLEIGVVLSDMRQYDPAIDYLTRAAERNPHQVEAWIELGLVAMQKGDDDVALRALTMANELEPFNIRASNSLALISSIMEYDRLDSDHFIIRYKPGDDEVLARDMLVVLERIHDRVTGKADDAIDHEPRVKTQIELMPNHERFAVRIAGMPALHTMAAATGPVLALEAPRVGAGHTVGHYDWPRVVQHEYTHTVTLSRTNNRIPHWMTEAAAVHLEDAPRDYSRCQMLAQRLQDGALFDLDEVSIAFIRPRHPSDRSMAYAQSQWMYEYIIDRWGSDAVLELMDAYARGDSQDEALVSVLDETPQEFMEDFEPWARVQVVSWGLLPREGEPTLQAIMLESALADEADRRGLLEWLADASMDAVWRAAGADAPPTPNPKMGEATLEQVDTWLEAHPTHADLLELAVRRRLDAGDGHITPELVSLLERYADARPVDPLPHRLLAQYYLDGEDKSLAIEHLAWLDAREQHSVAYAAELARRYEALKDWDDAHRYAERVTQMAPYRADDRELAARIAIQAKRYDDAERHLRALIMLEPDRDIHTKRLEAFMRLRQQADDAQHDRP